MTTKELLAQREEEIKALKNESQELLEDLEALDKLLTQTKQDIKKAKNKGILFGLLYAFLFGLLIIGAWVFAYLNGFFDDNGGNLWLEIDRNVDTSNNRVIAEEEATVAQEAPSQKVDDYIARQTDKILETIQDGYNEADAVDGGEREKNEALSEINGQPTSTTSSIEAPKIEQPTQQTPKYVGKITANDVDLVNLWELNKEQQKIRDFLATYYFLYKKQFNLVDFAKKWNAYDLKDKPNIDWNAIKQARPTTISPNLERDYLLKKAEIIKEMKDLKFNEDKTALIINPCYYSFCKENETVYGYVKQAMIRDTELKDQLLVAKKDWVSPKFYLTILLIENIRMHTQYKAAFKSVFLKYGSPKLAVMSKFSYWKYGTKVNFITQLMNNNYKDGSIFSIGDYPVLKTLKDNYYWQDKKWEWHPKNEGTIVSWLVSNKQAQTDIISAFFKMAQKGWMTQGVDLWKAENAWILLTLYNIGKLGEPKANPELWGATLQFINQKYNFGQLANVIYNSLELDDIMQQMGL